MKKLFLVLVVFMFVTIQTQAQENQMSASIGFDPANAFIGGTVNSTAMNYHIRFLYETGNPTISEISIFYESFEKLNFRAFGFTLSKTITYKKLNFLIGVENVCIMRWQGYLEKVPNTTDMFWAWGGTGEIRYKLSDNWKVSIESNVRHRTDDGGLNVFSGKINLIYRFK